MVSTIIVIAIVQVFSLLELNQESAARSCGKELKVAFQSQHCPEEHDNVFAKQHLAMVFATSC